MNVIDVRLLRYSISLWIILFFDACTRLVRKEQDVNRVRSCEVLILPVLREVAASNKAGDK